MILVDLDLFIGFLDGDGEMGLFVVLLRSAVFLRRYGGRNNSRFGEFNSRLSGENPLVTRKSPFRAATGICLQPTDLVLRFSHTNGSFSGRIDEIGVDPESETWKMGAVL
jgi:hypothetical protein